MKGSLGAAPAFSLLDTSWYLPLQRQSGEKQKPRVIRQIINPRVFSQRWPLELWAKVIS